MHMHVACIQTSLEKMKFPDLISWFPFEFNIPSMQVGGTEVTSKADHVPSHGTVLYLKF